MMILFDHVFYLTLILIKCLLVIKNEKSEMVVTIKVMSEFCINGIHNVTVLYITSLFILLTKLPAPLPTIII